jgi:hypothetical protein
MNFSNLPIDEIPIHVVMWKDSNIISQSSSQKEIADLRKRVEDLEQIVQRLIHEPSKPNQSPFFKSTSVPEPIGIEIISKLTLDESENNSVDDSPTHVKEVFHSLIQEHKQVTLNGMNFHIRKFGSDVVYCEEITGRSFLDPQDAFDNPTKKYIGYWNDKEDRMSIRSEPFTEDEEQGNQLEEEKPKVVIQEGKHSKVEVKEEAEEEEEEEAEELEEIEYKGKTYYKDSDNYVFEANEDGEVDTEKPIGIWDETKKKVLKYKA